MNRLEALAMLLAELHDRDPAAYRAFLGEFAQELRYPVDAMQDGRDRSDVTTEKMH